MLLLGLFLRTMRYGCNAAVCEIVFYVSKVLHWACISSAEVSPEIHQAGLLIYMEIEIL